MEPHNYISEGTPSDQAIEWLARLRADDVTPQEKADFATWLAASSLNKIAFDEAAELWQVLDQMPRQAVPTPTSRKRYNRALPFAAAASVLFACFMLVLQLTTPTYATGKGEQRRVLLADGSTAFMNTASKLSVDYSSDERRIILNAGEVWFDVASNPARPFVVQGAYAEAKAIGTAFTVRETPGFTRVSVTEGIVALSDDVSDPIDADHLLGVGEQGTVSATVTDVETFDPEQALAWQRGQLIYNDVRLGELLADLSRYLPKTMTVNDANLEDARVTASLYLDDQQAMLEALARVLPIRWKSVSDSLIIITVDS